MRLDVSQIRSLVLFLPLVLVGCKLESAPSSAEKTTGPSEKSKPRQAGTPLEMAPKVSFQFAVYYLPKPKKDPSAELDRLLKDYPRFRRGSELQKDVTVPTIASRINDDPKKNYAPPDLDLSLRFGRGLSRDQAVALQNTQLAFILNWRYSREHVWAGMRDALKLTEQLARNTGGVIWDEATREVFTPDALVNRRLKDWTNGVPQVDRHTVIHAYKNEETIRAITLGMEKFGLPDIVIDGFSWSLNRNMGHIINLFSQSMAEGARIEVPGEFDLNFRSVNHPKVREPQVSTLKSKATGIALLTLKKGTWETGDPKNRLVEITFDRGNGPDVFAKQEQVLSEAFGSEDSVTPVKHNAQIEAASQRARSKLPLLRRDFKKGLAPGEYVLVKVPFARPDKGNEWMWVEVSSWNGNTIRGLLKNEPYYIPTLRAGQMVTVSEAKVFDYIRRRADGTMEGNETGKLMKR